MKLGMATTGNVPNLQWNAVSTDRLRKEASYTALPPVHEIPLCGPESYRMIRQDSQLWDDLHKGVLTTGKLNACLGFYEPLAAKRLGIGKGFISHRGLLSVYHHLQQDVYVPPSQQLEASSTSSSLTDSEEKAWLQKRSRYAASRGSQSVRMSWGSAQEGATLYSLMHALPKSRLLEAGLFRLNEATLPKSWCFKKGELPPLGASPDGMLFHPEGLCQNADVVDAVAQLEVTDPEPQPQDKGEALQQVLDQIEVTQKAIQIRDWGQMPPLSIEGWRKAKNLGTFEIVEVKNRSPFRNSATGGYHIADAGPASFVPAMWIPQLQMEMLAADVGSALLVSRSATKGMTLIRVSRDDNFLKQMLVLIRRFYSNYVCKGAPPPENMFFQRNDYQTFLNATLRISRSSPLVAHVPSPRVHPTSDRRAFLE